MSSSANTQTIQIRIDQKTKEEVEKVLFKLGLNMSQAIKLFLKQVIITKSIPFSISLKSDIPNYLDESDIKHKESK
jgi:DNA-damage-inducible protein J